MQHNRRLHAAQPTSACSTTDVCMQHALPARCPQGGRLLEMNLMAAPQVADDIMADGMFTQEPAHPDRRQGHGPHQPAQHNYAMPDIANQRRLGAEQGGARHLQEGRAAPRGGQGAHRLHL
eukprot:scaffold81688_cov57-Phaeocystis_antarctica.AAC.1